MVNKTLLLKVLQSWIRTILSICTGEKINSFIFYRTEIRKRFLRNHWDIFRKYKNRKYWPLEKSRKKCKSWHLVTNTVDLKVLNTQKCARLFPVTHSFRRAKGWMGSAGRKGQLQQQGAMRKWSTTTSKCVGELLWLKKPVCPTGKAQWSHAKVSCSNP